MKLIFDAPYSEWQAQNVPPFLHQQLLDSGWVLAVTPKRGEIVFVTSRLELAEAGGNRVEGGRIIKGD